MISLTNDTINQTSTSSNGNDVDSEFALFMSEMEKEGVVSSKKGDSVSEEIKALEGSKCRAPHKHQWGDVVYHNAMICSVSDQNDGDYEVRRRSGKYFK